MVVLQPEDLLRDLLKMVSLDEPYGGGLPSWYVFQFMQQDVKVGMTGTGGDELFGDYGRYIQLEQRTCRARAAPLPAWLTALVASLVDQLPHGIGGLRRKERWRHYPQVRRDLFSDGTTCRPSITSRVRETERGLAPPSDGKNHSGHGGTVTRILPGIRVSSPGMP